LTDPKQPSDPGADGLDIAIGWLSAIEFDPN